MMSGDNSSFTGYAGPASFGAGNVERFEINRRLGRAATSTLVQIVRAPYDASGSDIAQGSPVPIGYVDVQPLVNQLDGLGNSMPHAVVYHASYWRYQGGLGGIIVDPVVGDIGKFVIADRDTSIVKSTNQQSNPGSGRRFNRADGTYFGATQGPLSGTTTKNPNQYVTFTANGIIIRDQSGNELALVSDTNLNPPTVQDAPAQYVALTSDGITIQDGNGNSIAMTRSGITITGARVNLVATSGNIEITVPGGQFVIATAGGTPRLVELSDNSPSSVLKADE